jgi:hypothetical protein
MIFLMLGKTKRLLLRAKPQCDESFLGFIVRLTERNDCDTPTWITQKAGIGYLGHKCTFVFDEAVDLSSLASMAGVDIADLESLKYPIANNSNTTFRRLFFGSPVPQYLIRLKSPKICPQCLRESAYCRRV